MNPSGPPRIVQPLSVGGAEKKDIIINESSLKRDNANVNVSTLNNALPDIGEDKNTPKYSCQNGRIRYISLYVVGFGESPTGQS